MWRKPYEKFDVESGAMVDSPELLYSLIPKVCCIIAMHLLATIVVGAVVITVSPNFTFFATTTTGYALKIVLMFVLCITWYRLYYYPQKHPVNDILLGIFTLSMTFLDGLSCAFTSKKDILEAGILTDMVVIAFIIYIFWAAGRGQDLKFLGLFLFGALQVLAVFGLILVLFPLGKFSMMIYRCVAATMFCEYMVFNINNLIKSYSSDEYIWAYLSLDLDIVEISIVSLLFTVQLIEIFVFLSVGMDGFEN